MTSFWLLLVVWFAAVGAEAVASAPAASVSHVSVSP